VRDLGNLAGVLAQPQDDPFIAAGTVARHFIEGVFDRGFRQPPELCL
jgi:hypothetical protein